MFVQTETTPNPNSLKFLPGKNVSNSGPYEITNKENIQNELVRNILSVNGVEGIFLGQDFISVNKNENINLNKYTCRATDNKDNSQMNSLSKIWNIRGISNNSPFTKSY